MMFFELRSADRSDIEALNLLRSIELGRAFYGAVILRGEGRHPDDSAVVRRCRSDGPITEIKTESGLLHEFITTGSTVSNGLYISAMLMWADVKFSEFAFDLLALLNGTYRQGFVSSFHGLEIRGGSGEPW
jgi:hypothetical protein